MKPRGRINHHKSPQSAPAAIPAAGALFAFVGSFRVDEKPITHFNPGTMPLCKHCVHAQPVADAHQCRLSGTVSYFGCSEFEREVGADDGVG